MKYSSKQLSKMKKKDLATYASVMKKVNADPMDIKKINKADSDDLTNLYDGVMDTQYTAEDKENQAHSNPKAWTNLITVSCKQFGNWDDLGEIREGLYQDFSPTAERGIEYARNFLKCSKVIRSAIAVIEKHFHKSLFPKEFQAEVTTLVKRLYLMKRKYFKANTKWNDMGIFKAKFKKVKRGAPVKAVKKEPVKRLRNLLSALRNLLTT